MAEKRRRFPWFWVYLFTACGSGCSGCCTCFGCDCPEEPSQGCNSGNDGCNVCENGSCGYGYDSGACASGRCGDAAVVPVTLTSGLVAPTALASDGTELFYVDQGELVRLDPNGLDTLALASGVNNVGNIESDGLYVYWSGTWAGEGSDDGGVDASTRDAGDAGDADAPDATASDAGQPLIPGIFRVAVTGGEVERIAELDPLPTLASDGTRLFLRARADDAGASTLGALTLDADGGFVPFAGLAGNTENMHAFALDGEDVVALDGDGVVSLAADGGRTRLAAGAPQSVLLSTSSGVVELTRTGSGATFALVALAHGTTATAAGSFGAVSARGDRILVASPDSGLISVFSAHALPAGPGVVVDFGAAPTLLAQDDFAVYWIAGTPRPALFTTFLR